MISSMQHTQLARWFVLSGLLALFAGAIVVFAQPPFTPTPTGAPGYTNVVVTAPVRATQDGAWTMKAVQGSEWTVKAVQGSEWTSKLLLPAPPFVRAQHSYLFGWNGATSTLPYFVAEVRPDGWLRATVTENGRRRDVWVNAAQLATIEEVP
jgi:hypothetical protein